MTTTTKRPTDAALVKLLRLARSDVATLSRAFHDRHDLIAERQTASLAHQLEDAADALEASAGEQSGSLRSSETFERKVERVANDARFLSEYHYYAPADNIAGIVAAVLRAAGVSE